MRLQAFLEEALLRRNAPDPALSAHPLSWPTAFAAGVVSFLSPCVLPLVPGYLSFMSGFSLDELTRENADTLPVRAAREAASFVLGFSTVFTLLGASASAVGQWLAYYRPELSVIAGILVIFFGLHMMEIVPIRWLYFERRFHMGDVAPGPVGAFLMGLAFAFGWTPCIGPILGGILALAAREHSAGRGMALLLCYSFGLGVPFILAGLATATFLRLFKDYKRYIHWGERVAGACLVLGGVLILSNKVTLLIDLLPEKLRRLAL